MDNPKKIIAIIILLSFAIGFAFPVPQAYAAGIPYWVKEYIIKPLVRTLANALENKIVNTMVAQISGKKQGQPNFITNWRNQILDSESRGNDIFRSVLADTQLCPYFKTNLQTAFGADKYAGTIAGATMKNSSGQVVYRNETNAPGLPSFQTLAGCTLPANFNASTFKTDFAKGGGWDTWNKLIQPQNNFFGTYALSLDQQVAQKATDTQSSQNQAIAGQGYLGQNLGKSGASPGACVGPLTNTNRCLFLGKQVTPASLLKDVNASSLGAKISRAGFGQELTDVIQGLIGAVTSGLLQGVANELGQTNYDSIMGAAGSLFDEANANNLNFNQANQANQAAQSSCKDACSTSFSECLNSCPSEPNNPAQVDMGSGCAVDCSQRSNQCGALCSQ